MKRGLISGWFDNQKTESRELWRLGEVQRAWPRVEIENSPHLDPWGTYPDVPADLADLPIRINR